MSASSCAVKTLPVGLFGWHRNTARVRGPNAARSSASSKVQSGSRSSTGLGAGPVVLIPRLEQHDLVAGVEQREGHGDQGLGGAAGHADVGLGIHGPAGV